MSVPESQRPPAAAIYQDLYIQSDFVATNGKGQEVRCTSLVQNPNFVRKSSAGDVRWQSTPAGYFRVFPESRLQQCTDGFYCPVNTTQPLFCCPGFYCKTPAEINICPEGKYCQRGSTQPEGCYFFATCPKGTEKPYRVGIFLFFLIMGVIILMFFNVKAKYDAKKQLKLKAIQEKLAKEKRQSEAAQEYGGKMAVVEKTFNIRCENLGRQLQNGTWIMRNVSGSLWGGRTLAIMGPSGAGKSTFISLLTKKAPRTTGKVFINDQIDELSNYKELIGFVPQEDIMLRELSVQKIILHSALMRLPASMPVKEKQEKALEVINFLGLSHVSQSVIGDEQTRGISGGQRKRVNIGMELVADPSVLFLDEPTSGLDSATSFEVCKLLKDIARLRMITVAAVIHSPSPSAFAQFDDLLLLGKGGEVCYFGPRVKCLQYFINLGFDYPEGESQADWFMNVISGLVPCRSEPNFSVPKLFQWWDNYTHNRPIFGESVDDSATITGEGKLASDIFHNGSVVDRVISAIGEAFQDVVEWATDVGKEIFGLFRTCTGAAKPARETPGFFTVFLLCFKRAAQQVFLSPTKFFLDLILHLGCGAFISIASQQMEYLGVQPDEICGITPFAVLWFCQNPVDHLREVGLFMSLGVLFAGVSVGTNTFGNERVVFWRDTAAGMPTIPYFLAKFLVDIPRAIIAAFMFTLALILVWSYRSSVFALYAIVLCLYLSAFTMGYFLSTIARRESVGLIGTGFAIAFGLVFSGVTPSYKEVMDPKNPVNYISFIWDISAPRYAIEALYIKETDALPWNELKSPNSTAYLEKGYKKDNFGYDIEAMLGVALVWAFLAFLGLKLLHRDKQK